VWKKEMKKKEMRRRKDKGITIISFVRRSCFAKHFIKTASTLLVELSCNRRKKTTPLMK